MILSLYAVILAIDLFDVKPLVLHHSYASYNILQPCAIIVEADTYREVCNMGTKLQMIYWKGNDFWVGKLLEHPEIMTQGKTIEDLENKRELTEGEHHLPFPVTCGFLVHSDPCMGFRISIDNKILAYCTDTGPCERSLELAQHADILIHECAAKKGQHYANWPHTDPVEAATIAKKAGVKQLLLFHFDAAAYRTLEDRKDAEAEARQIFENTVAAVDGFCIAL